LNRLPEFSAQLTWKKAQAKFKLLVQKFKKSDRCARISSGADNEEITEKEQLLADIIEIEGAKEKEKDKKKMQGHVILFSSRKIVCSDICTEFLGAYLHVSLCRNDFA
jgi:hypothetical protein